ncbi:MAG: hypothetical protein FRX49_06742 [Trebouxia sp. A1-2]|nr:MAG: hypothetical protein FRX49_06742 [Trebouxia sp. A1-2]
MDRQVSVEDIVGGLYKLGSAGFPRTDSEAAFQDFLKRIPSTTNLAGQAEQLNPQQQLQLQQHVQHLTQQSQIPSSSEQQDATHHNIGGIPRVPSLDFLRQLMNVNPAVSPQGRRLHSPDIKIDPHSRGNSADAAVSSQQQHHLPLIASQAFPLITSIPAPLQKEAREKEETLQRMLSAEKRVRTLEEENRQLRREAAEVRKELDRLRKECSNGQKQGNGSSKSPRSSSQRVSSPSRKRQCSGASHDELDNGAMDNEEEENEMLLGKGGDSRRRKQVFGGGGLSCIGGQEVAIWTGKVATGSDSDDDLLWQEAPCEEGSQTQAQPSENLQACSLTVTLCAAQSCTPFRVQQLCRGNWCLSYTGPARGTNRGCGLACPQEGSLHPLSTEQRTVGEPYRGFYLAGRGLSRVRVIKAMQLTKQLLDDKELIDVTIPWEQGLAIDEFSHDAAHSPHIHFLAVVAAAQQQFWSPLAGKAKITQFQLTHTGISYKAQRVDNSDQEQAEKRFDGDGCWQVSKLAVAAKTPYQDAQRD